MISKLIFKKETIHDAEWCKLFKPCTVQLATRLTVRMCLALSAFVKVVGVDPKTIKVLVGDDEATLRSAAESVFGGVPFFQCRWHLILNLTKKLKGESALVCPQVNEDLVDPEKLMDGWMPLRPPLLSLERYPGFFRLYSEHPLLCENLCKENECIIKITIIHFIYILVYTATV